MAAPAPATFAHLLESAVTEPGVISSAYQQFHNYSLGNQLLAWSQCIERGLLRWARLPPFSGGRNSGAM